MRVEIFAKEVGEQTTGTRHCRPPIYTFWMLTPLVWAWTIGCVGIGGVDAVKLTDHQPGKSHDSIASA